MASVLAMMIATGVFSSWPASVMNCFCRSMFFAMGAMDLRASTRTKKYMTSMHRMPTSREVYATRTTA